MLDVPFRSARQLAADIKKKKIGCLELLDLYLARVEKYDGALNAVVVRDFERARTRARAPGGSSGGSAAALAAGLTGLEAGSDIGSSIRNPAHFCGVFGHKPTWGIVPRAGQALPWQGAPVDIDVVGPLARSTDDLALAL